MIASANDNHPGVIGTPVVAPGRRLWPRVTGFVLLLAAIAGGGYYTYLRNETPATGAAGAGPAGADAKKGGGRFGAGPASVVAATARTDGMDVRLNALGNVVPRNSVVVRPRVDGPLLRVHFKEGQIIKAGQLLAEIDPQPLQVALAQANGQLARDQALLQNAQIDLQRYKSLLATDSIATQQVDTQESTVRQYQGVVASDRGQVDAAKLQLSYTRITAPITGQVGLRQVDPGNIVRTADANGLVSITQMDPITVVFAIPEAQVSTVLKRLREESEVPVEAWDSGQKLRLGAGKLLSTDNQIDSATGTLKLKAEFPNQERSLFPNQFVNVRMLLGREEGLVVVPAAAVQRGAQGTFAYVVKEDSTVSMRQVRTGIVDGDRVAIASGLKAGERVVIDGADKLREGGKVEVIDRNTPPPGSRSPGEGRRNRGDGKGGERKAGETKAGETKAGETKAGAAKAGAAGSGQGARTDGGAVAPADADREERRRRYRDIMENGTDAQKAEATRRFRERMEANKAAESGAPAKAAP